jgi:hypothetical protein
MIFVMSLSTYISIRLYGNTMLALQEWPKTLTVTALIAGAPLIANLYLFVRRQNKEIHAEERIVK